MLNRHLKAFGLLPILGYLLGVFIFIGLSSYIFYKTKYAVYIYPFIAISFLSSLSETKRCDFLHSCFTDKDYFKVRLLENLIIVMPFVLFSVYKNNFSVPISLIIIAFLMTRFSFNNQLNYTIPTPFHKFPFEFTVGFRNAFGGFIIAYFLAFMGISVGNFNLGISGLVLVFLICFSFYFQPDSNYYVWIFSSKPSRFVFSKIGVGLLYSTVFSLPIALGLGIYFIENQWIIFIFQLIGYIYLSTIILAKYAAFPSAMNLPQTIFILLSMVFPPFLLFVIPFFYRQSIKKLTSVLA